MTEEKKHEFGPGDRVIRMVPSNWPDDFGHLGYCYTVTKNGQDGLEFISDEGTEYKPGASPRSFKLVGDPIPQDEITPGFYFQSDQQVVFIVGRNGEDRLVGYCEDRILHLFEDYHTFAPVPKGVAYPWNWNPPSLTYKHKFHPGDLVQYVSDSITGGLIPGIFYLVDQPKLGTQKIYLHGNKYSWSETHFVEATSGEVKAFNAGVKHTARLDSHTKLV